jgi:predicted nucleic acid-binding protein
VILLDTSGLLAAIDSSHRHHERAARALAAAPAPRLLSPFVLAELHYLLATRVALSAELSLLAEVGRGVYRLEPFTNDDVAEAAQIVDRFSDQAIGLADASIVVLAARHGTRDVLTLDERHFRALRVPRGRAFRILPADAT